MANLSGNTCEIVTLLPLGVVCNSTNATTPVNTNGSIYLNITGGSAPYNITWSNGGQGQSLINLKPGDYTATIVDYYGDYSATTTCTVGYDSFSLDKFEDCSNSGTYVYYRAQEPSIFTAGLIYELDGRSGCWTSSGTTLWTSESYVDSFATIKGGPHNDCETCLPEPTPTPVYPQYICLTKNSAPYTQYTFESGSTVYNGFPVWEETGSTTYKMVYKTTNSSWVMSGWTGGILQSVTTSGPPPTGIWLSLGSSETWTAVSGLCTTTPIQVSLRLSNPTCAGSSDGEIMVIVNGGVPTYQYSLDGVTYQNSSIFSNLNAGSGTVFVKDSLGTITTTTYTLTNQTTSVTYTNKVAITGSTNPVINLQNYRKKYQWGFKNDTNPSINSPKVMTYDLVLEHTIRRLTSNGTSPTIITGVTVNTVGNVSISGPIETWTTQTYSRPDGCTLSNSNTILEKVVQRWRVTVTGVGYVSGVVISDITCPSVGNACYLKGEHELYSYTENYSIANNVCDVLPGKTTGISLVNDVQGLTT
jgi:hypothetical protein